MASCGTDLIHHIDFLNNSEKYRRYFIKTLNDEYTYGRFLSEEGGKKSSGDFFLNQLKTLSIIKPSFLLLLSYYYIDIFSILFWFSSLVLLISYTSKKIEIQ